LYYRFAKAGLKDEHFESYKKAIIEKIREIAAAKLNKNEVPEDQIDDLVDDFIDERVISELVKK